MSEVIDSMPPPNRGGRPTLSGGTESAVKVGVWVPPERREEFESLVTRWAERNGFTPADARRSILAHGIRAVSDELDRQTER